MAYSSICTIAEVGETSTELPMELCQWIFRNAKFVIVGQNLLSSVPFQIALKYLPGKKFYSDTGFELIHNSENHEMIFILHNFDGSLFQQLNKKCCRIVAPPVIIRCAFLGEPFPFFPHPLFCTLMKHVVICFNGFKFKKLHNLVDLVHHMGGSVRKDFSAEVTHLVTNCSSGIKYRAAVTFGTCIMSEEWIYRCWEARDDIRIHSTDERLMQFKLSSFAFAVISFYGFSDDETRHMEELVVSNGGSVAYIGAPMTTHLVINSGMDSCPVEVSNKTFIVQSKWFWSSIQMEACADETLFQFADLEEMRNSQSIVKISKTRLNGSKGNIHKCFPESSTQLALEGVLDSPTYKQCSSGVMKKSLSSSFLDATAELDSPTHKQCSTGAMSNSLSSSFLDVTADASMPLDVPSRFPSVTSRAPKIYEN